MTEPSAEHVRLPYPHRRNDCGMCRERDADFHVLGDQYNRPDTGYRTLLCRQCIGGFLVTHALYGQRSGNYAGGPVMVEFEVLLPLAEEG